MAKLITLKLIFSEEKTGAGKDGDPVRLLQNYYSADGTLLLSYDPCLDKTSCVINLVRELAEISR